MSKIISIFIFVLSAFSCSSNEQNYQFNIFDSRGQAYYSSSIGEQLRKEYGIERNPKMILLLTENSGNSAFQKQLTTLSNISPEDYQYIYVIGNISGREYSGYNITRDEARSMLSDNKFQIRIYNEFGYLIASSKQNMAKEMVIHHLTKSSSGR